MRHYPTRSDDRRATLLGSPAAVRGLFRSTRPRSLSATRASGLVRPDWTRGVVRRDPRWQVCLGLLFAIALAVRLIYATAGLGTLPWILDEMAYFGAAVRMAEGGIRLPDTGIGTPIVPALLAVPLRAFGVEASTARLSMAALGALVAPLTALAGAPILGRRGASWAGLAAAVWPPILFWQGLVMSEAAASIAVLGLVWLVTAFWPGHRWSPILAGSLTAAATLIRPNLIILLPLLAGWLAIAAGDRRRGWLGLCLMVTAYATTMLPWWHRQYEIQGAFVLTTVKAGDVLLGANNPSTYAGPEAFGWIDPVTLPEWWGTGWEDLSEVERDRRRTQTALDFVRTHVDRLPAVAAWRSLDFWQLHLGQKRDDLPNNPQDNAAVQGVHLIVLALATTTVLTWSRYDRRIALASAIVLANAGIAIVFWGGGGRFRSPFDPLILILAMVGVTTIVPPLRAWRGTTTDPDRWTSS